MPDDENTTQNPISEKNSIPASPQEPTEPAPENTAHSEPSDALPEAPESSPNDFSVKSNEDIPPSNSTSTEAENEPKTEEEQAENEPSTEPVSEPVEALEPETAQIAGNEPFEKPHDKPLEEPKRETKTPELEPEEEKPRTSYLKSQRLGELLVMARNAIQFRKRRKLDRIMTLFEKKKNGSTGSPQVTNDEVEKFLHVSDATATRYLSQLEKEGKIKQNGKTGKGVSYSKI